MSFQGWLLAWIRHRKSKVDVCIPTSSHDVCANVGGNGCGLIDIGVGAFTLIESLGLQANNRYLFTIFGTFGQESIPNQISQFGIHIRKDGE